MSEESEVFLAGKIVPYSSEIKIEKRVDLNEEGESLLTTLTITEYRDINEKLLEEFIDQQKLRRSIMKNQKVTQSVLQEYSLNATDLYIVRQVSIKLETDVIILFADFDENRINEFNEHNKVQVNLYNISNFLINALATNEATNNVVLFQPNNGVQYYLLLREEGKRIQIPMASEQGKEDPDDADDEAGIATQEQDNNNSSNPKLSSSSSDEYTKQEEPPMSSDLNSDNNPNNLSSSPDKDSRMRRPTQTDSSSIAQMEDFVFAAAAKVQSPRTATTSDSEGAALPPPQDKRSSDSMGSDFDDNLSPPVKMNSENDKINSESGSNVEEKQNSSSSSSKNSSDHKIPPLKEIKADKNETKSKSESEKQNSSNKPEADNKSNSIKKSDTSSTSKNSQKEAEEEPNLSDSLHSLSQNAPIESTSSSSGENLGGRIKERVADFFGRGQSGSGSDSGYNTGENTDTDTKDGSKPIFNIQKEEKKQVSPPSHSSSSSSSSSSEEEDKPSSSSSSSSSSEDDKKKEEVKEEVKPSKPPSRRFGLIPNFAAVRKREQVTERSIEPESKGPRREPVYKATSRAKRHDLFVSDSDHELEKEEDGHKRYEKLGKRSRWLVQSSDDESIEDFERKAKNEVLVRTTFADDELSEEGVYKPKKCSRVLPTRNTYLKKSESSSSDSEKSSDEEIDHFERREKLLREKMEKRKLKEEPIEAPEEKEIKKEKPKPKPKAKPENENKKETPPENKEKETPAKKGKAAGKKGKKGSPEKKSPEKVTPKQEKVPEEKAAEKVPEVENQKEDKEESEKKEVKKKVIASKFIAADFSDVSDTNSSDDLKKLDSNPHKKRRPKKHVDKEKEAERKLRMELWEKKLKENEAPREYPKMMGSKNPSTSEQKNIIKKSPKKGVKINKPAPIDPKSPLVATKFIGFESSDDEIKEPKRISKTTFKDDSTRGERIVSKPTRTKTIKRVASSTDDMLNKQ